MPFAWLRKLRAPASAPLTGAPSVRRLKTYSAQSGYVYQYFYEGRRAVVREREEGAEFVFSVSADRKDYFAVSLFLSSSAVGAWAESHGRLLNDSERYAIAKLALMRAFDERSNPQQMRQEVQVTSADVESILDTLGID